MDHVAIMNPRWKLIEKILTGKKTIESRWYVNHVAPWNRIFSGDTVYFKDAGKPITAKARVKKVVQFENLTQKKVQEILKKYGSRLALVNADDRQWFKRKQYSILIFLKNPQPVQPFFIDKTGFGSAAAWITVSNIDKIKK